MEKLSWNKIKHFYETYERHLGIGFMLVGFIIDNLTLTRIDLLYDNLILTFYLVLSLTCIILINGYDNGRFQIPFVHKIHQWLPIPMQIAFGGLFSGCVVFYSRSASFVVSWPFITMLVVMMIGNELAKSRYERFTYQISVFYAALISFSIFFLPVVTKRMGAGIFIASGITSLAIIALVVLALYTVARPAVEQSLKWLIVSIGSIFILFQFLYFTNIIPPVPLSLKSIGVYHNLRIHNAVYDALLEPAPWYNFFYSTSRTFHRTEGERVFVESAVFAPTKLSAPILHRWMHYNESVKKWEEYDTIAFSIIGGRDGGYRGFSYKQNILPGKWRVDVVTEREQLLGRITFRIESSETKPLLKPVKL